MEFTTSKDGTRIGYTTSGGGRPLLLVHGTTADHTRWSGVSSRFEQHFTVFAMDRRGRGGSSDGIDYNIMREAEDVAAVVEAIEGKVSVVGHSYGAVCSLEAALLTEDVERMILYEPPIPTGIPMYPQSVPDRMQSLIDAGRHEAALEVFMQEVVRMPDDELAAYRALPMWNKRVQLAPTIPRELAIDQMYEFRDDRFSGLGVPVALLLGGVSPPLFQRAIQKLDSALSNSTVVKLPGQQHVAMDTNVDLFIETVLRLLAN